MGCGCGKKTNVIRNQKRSTNSQTKVTAEAAKAARKNRLKKIKITATKRSAPKK
jgi:hypothetical protein